MSKRAVKAFILNNDKILILRQSPVNDRSFWELPGGSVKGDENPSEAIHREIKEETGLVITDLREIGIKKLMTNNEYWEEYVYVGNNTDDSIFLSDEHIDYQLIPFAEIERLKNSAIQDYELDFYKKCIT